MRYAGFIALIILLGTTVSLAGDPTGTGYDIGSQVRDKWGNPEALNQKLAQPLLTGSVPLSTLDDSRSGTAQIACPGTQSIFEILVQPSATNDLQMVSITYDSDLDGAFDGSLAITDPIFVSGVCANGFISCTPGTWNDCTWYKWKFDGTLSYEAVSPSDLGGCYCFNTSCTSTPFLLMKDKILQDLGGGVAAAMAAYNPRLSVSKAQVEDLVIRYFGQNTGECSTSNVVSTYGFPTPEDSYYGTAELSVLTTNEVSSQSSDPDSFYNLLTSSTAATGGISYNCTLQRSVYVDASGCNVVDSYTDNCAILETDPNCSLEEEIVYDVDGNPVTTYSNFNPTGVAPVDTCVTFNPEDYANCVINCNGDITTDGGCTGICYTGYISSVEYLGDSLWKVHLKRTNTNSCGDIFDYQVCGKFEGSWNIADDPCVSVTLDGNDVISPFCYHSDNSTPSSGTFSGDTGSTAGHLVVSLDNLEGCNGWASGSLTVYMKLNIPEAVCHDWWKIERTYVCTGTPTYDPDVSRADTIAETLSEGTGTWTYTDPATGTGSVDLNVETGETCIQACKLMITEDRAQASATDTTADYRSDPTSVTYIYRTCIDGTCPVNPGETIVKDCQCLNDFDEAASAMESLHQASEDMICSDGVPKE